MPGEAKGELERACAALEQAKAVYWALPPIPEDRKTSHNAGIELGSFLTGKTNTPSPWRWRASPRQGRLPLEPACAPSSTPDPPRGPVEGLTGPHFCKARKTRTTSDETLTTRVFRLI